MSQARTFPRKAYAEGEPVVIREGVTTDEYFRLPETGAPSNLIDGRLYVSPSPFANHQRIVLAIGHARIDEEQRQLPLAHPCPPAHLPKDNRPLFVLLAQHQSISHRWT